MRPTHTLNHTPNHAVRRVISFSAFLKIGGVTGMVRAIVYRWNHPFNINQLKVAYHRRHPELIPGDHQIEDIIEFMVERRLLVLLPDGQYQRAQSVKGAA